MTRILNMNGGCGLFAVFIQAVSFYYEYPDDDIILKIMDNSPYLDSSITWTDNPWEYYFCQSHKSNGEVIEHNNEFGKLMRNNGPIFIYNHPDSFFDAAYGIIQEKIKVRKVIYDEMMEFYVKYMEGHKILSVHKRNLTHYQNYKNHHPVGKKNITAEDCVNKIDLIINDYDKIFLLTDEIETLDLFKKKYGEDLIHRDSKMTHSGTYVLDIYGGYNIGKEVLIEVLLASKTDYFVPAKSNVSVAVRMFNRDIEYDKDILW